MSNDGVRKMAKAAFAAVDVMTPAMPGPRLLIYHEITSEPARQMDLAPELFERQVEWLQDRGSVVPLEQALGMVDDPGSDRVFVLTFDDGHAGLARFAYPYLESRRIPFTLYITSGLLGDGPEHLTWDEVRQMLQSGLLTVGAHTHSHPDLRTIDADQIERELELSDEMIEANLGVRPRHFAYPKGFWSEAAEPLLRKRYETSVLGAGEPIVPGVDPHRLSRVPVQRADGFLFFKRKVIGGMRAEESIRRRLKGYENPPSIERSGVSKG